MHAAGLHSCWHAIANARKIVVFRPPLNGLWMFRLKKARFERCDDDDDDDEDDDDDDDDDSDDDDDDMSRICQ